MVIEIIKDIYIVPTPKGVCTHTERCLYPRRKVFVPTPKGVCTHTERCLYPHRDSNPESQD